MYVNVREAGGRVHSPVVEWLLPSSFPCKRGFDPRARGGGAAAIRGAAPDA